MSTERRQPRFPAAGAAFQHENGAASHSQVRAIETKLRLGSPEVTAYRGAESRDGSADRSVVCLDRATVSRPELAARPTLHAKTSSIEGQHRLGQKGLEALGRQGYAVGVAGVAALAGRDHLTGK